MANPQQEPLEAIAAAIKSALPKCSIKTGEGADLSDFMTEFAKTKPAAFVSYGGFEASSRYNDGRESGEGREIYTAFFIADKDIRSQIQAFREWLREDDNDRFTDDTGAYCRICAERGAAIRYNSLPVFELTISII